jgi:DNA-binding Lrp family transcriptional regulator
MEKIKNGIIKLLGENARYTAKQIADMLGEDEQTIKALIGELEESGIIVKYAAILNADALQDTRVKALIEVKVAPQKLNGFDAYAEQLIHFPEVQSLYLMSGGFDLAVFVEGEGITDIAKFIAEKLSVIDGIVSVQTHFILKKYKIEGQVTKPTEECKRQIIHV